MKFNKVVMIFLTLACLFIAVVMISLLFQGVTPQAQKMVKWSSVEFPEKAGDRLALFLFPLLKESKRVNIQRGQGFSELFFKSFLKRVRAEAIETEIQRIDFVDINSIDSMDKAGDFSIFIFQLKDQVLRELCMGGKKMGCLGERALNQFNRKQRDPSVYWITMDRLEKNKAVLFFQPPTGKDMD